MIKLIKERQIQFDDLDNYKPLEQPMEEERAKKAKKNISELYQRNHIDSMTKKWPNPPGIPVFYTLTKIHYVIESLLSEGRSYRVVKGQLNGYHQL